MKILEACFLVIVITATVNSSPIADHDLSNEKNVHRNHHRTRRATENEYRRMSPSDRPKCKSGSTMPRPPNEVNTTSRLQKLRALFPAYDGIKAYYIPTEDAHQSEYVAAHDERRVYISGFSGSAGTAVVTEDKAALWTDGRYFLQAEAELDCNWILMKQGETGVPSSTEWLGSLLSAGDKVGANPTLMPIDSWQVIENRMKDKSISLIGNSTDLVDEIWPDSERPAFPNGDIIILNTTFSGKSWKDKVTELRKKMADKNTRALFVTALDETAWLFNLRGSDIAYNPFFISYAIVEENNVRFYLSNKTGRLTPKIAVHLSTGTTGDCSGKTGICVQVKPYEDALSDMKNLNDTSSTKKVWISPASSYAVYSSIPASQVLKERSPIQLLKAVKNQVERDGYERCQIRDSAALIEFLAMLEKDVKSGSKQWNEISAASKLEEYRRMQQYNMGLSFNTISAVGSNGAVIHYSPAPSTNKNLTTTEMYLLDSGGQYLDGTTDVTRTLHFGTPTEEMKQAYTRVLMGAINLAMMIWPEGTYGREIDSAARAPLWSYGWNYRHGTGHGIGAFLSVHEGPGRICLGSVCPVPSTRSALYEHMFFSDEPGYYEPDQFGVRLETIVMVVKANTPNNFGNKTYLTFKPVTLVPFETHLIKYDLLDDKQTKWLNDYHAECMEKVGKVLQAAGKTEAYKWMEARVQQISTSGQAFLTANMLLAFCLVVISRVL
ncbi:xaa-Pro aminopeptidase 1 isoform X2 [Lingula anatina]|uniref:Xaa-Pro aminopeptidase 1 isoform X2 n=1 Tax=Lingula anatina TaxID=7574 RepID=A0A1S3JV05_LINAN|nr:xaa-Pro aminopeptidase 1 isoform X2 [Lingula anatina]|eukprot:XP_013414158.1 xaa-Pro aminopeptidase 1 isoform X2 [Lingula anatina]